MTEAFRQAALDPPERAGRTYPPYPLLAVSIAVFRADRVLLARRTRPPYLGLFSLPGGLVETGETLAGAALRELFEEVQVEAEVVAFNRHVESIERDDFGDVLRHYVIASFAGRWVSGEGSTGPEASETVWMAPSRLHLLDCTPLTQDVVDAAQAIVETERRGAF